jgi:hypothetical protein
VDIDRIATSKLCDCPDCVCVTTLSPLGGTCGDCLEGKHTYVKAADRLLTDLQRRRDEANAKSAVDSGASDSEWPRAMADSLIATGQVIAYDAAIARVRVYLPGIESDAKDSLLKDAPDDEEWDRKKRENEALEDQAIRFLDRHRNPVERGFGYEPL